MIHGKHFPSFSHTSPFCRHSSSDIGHVSFQSSVALIAVAHLRLQLMPFQSTVHNYHENVLTSSVNYAGISPESTTDLV